MKLLKIKTQVNKYDFFGEFIQEFKVGKKDLIFTSQFLYTKYMKELNLKATIIIKDEYGRGEPSDEMMDHIIEKVKEQNFSRVIAIGGGSIIDIGKILALRHTNKVLDLFEKKEPIIKEKELIVIPTTCGTGSEVTNISIAEIRSKHTKMGLAVDALYPDYAALIPELMKDLPYKFFATSSIDALIHAVESFLSPKSNNYTELFSMKGMELILRGYVDMVKKGKNYKIEVLENFIIGSNYAGIAFDNTGVGAVHALSYPLGGRYHVPHGEANYQFFLAVLKKYFKKNPTGKILKLNKIFEDILQIDKDIYDFLEKLLEEILPRKPLREYGMKKEEVTLFTDSVLKMQQRLLINNYTPFSREDILSIYDSLY